MSDSVTREREKTDVLFLQRMNSLEACCIKSRETRGNSDRPQKFGICVKEMGNGFSVWERDLESGKPIEDTRKQNLSAEEVIQEWWVD